MVIRRSCMQPCLVTNICKIIKVLARYHPTRAVCSNFFRVEWYLANSNNQRCKIIETNDSNLMTHVTLIHTGHEKIVRTLVDNGADINAVDNNGYPALISAAPFGKFHVDRRKNVVNCRISSEMFAQRIFHKRLPQSSEHLYGYRNFAQKFE